jgi:hypothetical protein
MKELLTFTEKDFDRPRTRFEEVAATVEEMFDGENPVRTLDVANYVDRPYGTVKTQLHIAGKRGLIKGIPRKGWLPIKN